MTEILKTWIQKLPSTHLAKKVLQIFLEEKLGKALILFIGKSACYIYRKSFLVVFRKSYFFVDLIIYPILKRFYSSRISRFNCEMQFFFVTREDFGTYLVSLHYVGCWQRQRGPICAVILAGNPWFVRKIFQVLAAEASIICADFFWLKVVIFLYGASWVHRSTFSRLYAQLAMEHPSSLFIYEQPLVGPIFLEKHSGKSRYVKFLDPHFEKMQGDVPSNFLDAYLNVRKFVDYRLDVHIDYVRLHNHEKFKDHLKPLQRRVSALREFFKFDNEYVVININCKKYFEEDFLNRKQILSWERYNCIIDRLIEKGYTVILQGREEQPKLSPRKGLYDYARSAMRSIENDLALYAGALFAISSKSGPENFSTVCNIPLLGLEYVELCSMTPHQKLRFYPKQILRKATNAIVSWEELLASPCYFDIGPNGYDNDIEYKSMKEEELITALEEFLPLAEDSFTDWTCYTPLQKEFKNKLHPLHLDLFYIPGVPCDAYLKSFSRETLKCAE